jgi:hypothetical protein
MMLLREVSRTPTRGIGVSKLLQAAHHAGLRRDVHPWVGPVLGMHEVVAQLHEGAEVLVGLGATIERGSERTRLAIRCFSSV